MQNDDCIKDFTSGIDALVTFDDVVEKDSDAMMKAPPISDSPSTQRSKHNRSNSKKIADDSQVASFVEPILSKEEHRYSIFPIKYDDVWSLYLKSVESFWTFTEVPLGKDVDDFDKLNPDEQHFIKMILGFFSGSDSIVLENLSERFATEVQIPEARCFYATQGFIESIHSVVYSQLIDAYVKDSDEKLKLFNAIKNYPCIAKKAQWAERYISDHRSSFGVRLIAFSIVEGIFFSSSFAAIYWIKQRNILPGLCLSNEYISRDEALHVEHAVLLYSKLVRKVSKKKFQEIMQEAVEIEIDFICNAIPCRLIGMNSGLMTEYIKFVADRLCMQLGYDKIYNAKNSFQFMELISVEKKTNFFEHRVSEYALANKTIDDKTFDLNCDF